MIKDSGKKDKFDSGFQRDSGDGKPNFDLIPYEVLKQIANHYTEGARKYGENNWRKASTEEEYKRFKRAALRHILQWSDGQVDEDHLSACIWNLMSYEWHTNYKINKK